MTRKEVLKKALAGEMSWVLAAEVLRLSPRQVRRLRKRYAEAGEAGLLDLRLGRKNGRAISEDWKKKVCEIYRTQYVDFSALHFFEKLTTQHKLRPACYVTIKNWLQDAGLLERNAKRARHRKRRERRPMAGMLIHLDGSTHAWLGETRPNLDLLVMLDDATSEVYSAEFVAQEGTLTCMGVIRETIEKRGIFCSLYVDRAMHFVITTKTGQKPDRTRKSQIERALDRLGTELICAYTPQARGRSERLWRTWQGRLPQELRAEGITTMEAANQYLKEVFVPWHNSHLTCQARETESSAFIAVPPTLDLRLLFSIQQTRYVNSDNTVQFKTRVLQIEAKPSLRFSFAGVKVTVHEHADQTISITYGPHLLGRYNQEGIPLKAVPNEPKGSAAAQAA